MLVTGVPLPAPCIALRRKSNYYQMTPNLDLKLRAFHPQRGLSLTVSSSSPGSAEFQLKFMFLTSSVETRDQYSLMKAYYYNSR